MWRAGAQGQGEQGAGLKDARPPAHHTPTTAFPLCCSSSAGFAGDGVCRKGRASLGLPALPALQQWPEEGCALCGSQPCKEGGWADFGSRSRLMAEKLGNIGRGINIAVVSCESVRPSPESSGPQRDSHSSPGFLGPCDPVLSGLYFSALYSCAVISTLLVAPVTTESDRKAECKGLCSQTQAVQRRPCRPS